MWQINHFFLSNTQPYNTLYMCVFSFSIISIATVMLLPLLTSLRTGAGLVYKIITYIALISYSMYLVNYSLILKFILPILMQSFGQGSTSIPYACIKLIVFISVTVSTSILLYKYCEKPFLNLRKESN